MIKDLIKTIDRFFDIRRENIIVLSKGLKKSKNATLYFLPMLVSLLLCVCVVLVDVYFDKNINTFGVFGLFIILFTMCSCYFFMLVVCGGIGNKQAKIPVIIFLVLILNSFLLLFLSCVYGFFDNKFYFIKILFDFICFFYITRMYLLLSYGLNFLTDLCVKK